MSVIMKESENKVGGQAVIEGVMMRSPNSLAVAVRRPDNTIVIKEQAWQSIWKRMKFLRWPFFRGTVVLIESLWNGISALTFSANQAFDEEDDKKDKSSEKTESEPEPTETSTATGPEEAKKDEPLGTLALVGTIFVSFTFAIGLFVILPHLLTLWFGQIAGKELTVDSLLFHAIDGVIKVLFFVGYVWAISFMKDIKRVFQYHGAEHMAIFAYEDGKELTVDNVRPYGTYHPRCGTSFIMVVLLISIILFSLVFPFMPNLDGINKILRNLIYIAIKIPLMLPIAGLSYELIKLAAKKPNNPLLRIAVLPGLWLQRITTQRPDDSMLEISILSLKKCLWREQNLSADGIETIKVYSDFDCAKSEMEVAPESAAATNN